MGAPCPTFTRRGRYSHGEISRDSPTGTEGKSGACDHNLSSVLQVEWAQEVNVVE